MRKLDTPSFLCRTYAAADFPEGYQGLPVHERRLVSSRLCSLQPSVLASWAGNATAKASSNDPVVLQRRDKWVVAGNTPPRATVQASLANDKWLIEVVVTAAAK